MRKPLLSEAAGYTIGATLVAFYLRPHRDHFRISRSQHRLVPCSFVMVKILSSKVSEDSDISHMPVEKYFPYLNINSVSELARLREI
ncbi:MAG: hypothetical protein GQ542_17595 [Desulforhopalus sp.]|nr:hypothetical protein [Desulforhopalus sp.]